MCTNRSKSESGMSEQRYVQGYEQDIYVTEKAIEQKDIYMFRLRCSRVRKDEMI